MRNFMMLSALVLSLGGLAACGNKGDKALDKMEEHVNKICACKDMDCATKAAEAMTKDMESMAKDMAGEKGSKAQEERATKITQKMTDCMTKLAGAGAPAATP